MNVSVWVRRLSTPSAVGIAVLLVLDAGVAGAGVARAVTLGKKNTSQHTTTLIDPAGTPLSLQAGKSKPPLTVNNSTQVPKLNSSLLDGKSASQLQSQIQSQLQSQTEPRFERTVVVSPASTAAASGARLLAAVAAITTASASTPYLIQLEPGTYDVGSGGLAMKPYVDISGSGNDDTEILAEAAVGVAMTGNTALSRVYVDNTGGSNADMVGISASSSSGTIWLENTRVSAGTAGTQADALRAASGFIYADDSNFLTLGASSSGIDVGNAVVEFRNGVVGGAVAVSVDGSGGAEVATSLVAGPVANNGGAVVCVDDYDGNYESVTC